MKALALENIVVTYGYYATSCIDMNLIIMSN